ncbi:carbamoyltransferase HypF, partial [bacterium]|nr:carbamoyltransferase HypF [bacterium]
MNTPCPIHLDFELRPVLAVGAELKNTFCLTRGNLAFLSQPIGDLKNLETLEFFKQEVERYKNLLLIEPEIVAHDLHPDYLGTKFAEEYCSVLHAPCSVLPIQHHHAHIASCMAENGITEKVIGVAADGMGFGEDGKIWGFEFLLADFHGYKRCAHLKYIPMPGGDKATQEPWRMAVSYLYSACADNLPGKFIKRWGQD